MMEVFSYGQALPKSMRAAFWRELENGQGYRLELNGEDEELLESVAAAGAAGLLGPGLATRGYWIVGRLTSGSRDAQGRLCFALDCDEFIWLCDLLLGESELSGSLQAASLRIDLLSTIEIEEI